MKTSYRKLKRDINKYNKTVESANKLMNKMMKGGLMEYMDGGHVNPAAAMFGANSQKISNMSSPLYGVNTARLQLGYPKAAYGMSMDTYGMGGYSPSFSVPQGQMGMPVKTETNDAGMSYAIPVMYQEGGKAMSIKMQSGGHPSSMSPYLKAIYDDTGNISAYGRARREDRYPKDFNYDYDTKPGSEFSGLPPVTYSMNSQGMPVEAYTLPTATVTDERIPTYFSSQASDAYFDILERLYETDRDAANKFAEQNYGKGLSELDPRIIKEAERTFNKYYNKGNKPYKYKKQEGGEAMPNSQDMAMAMAQQEGAPMPPMQPGMEQGMEQPMPEQQPQQDEQMMQQLVQLAQAALAGDEQAIQMIQQLPPEQQQIILQIMEEMEAQGGQPMPQAAPEQGMEPGMEQGMMMYGGIMNATNKSSNMMEKKKKSKKSKSNSNKMMMGGYAKRKTSMKKMNKLYNSLGIPC